MDIAFRILHEQQTANEKNQKKEKKRRKMQDLNLSTESTTEDDEIDNFAVLSQKVFCKFTIQAKGVCFLLQLEKRYLVEMIDLFHEILVQLVSQEWNLLFKTVR